MSRAAALIAIAAASYGILTTAGCGAGGSERTDATPAREARSPVPFDAGVPAGWVPKQTLKRNLVVTKAGTEVHDVLLENADLVVDAPDVTIRRVKLEGGRIHNLPGSTCRNGMVIEDSTIEPAPGASSAHDSEGVVGYGGYTARRVKIWRRSEGFRVGGRSAGCGAVRIERSFAKLVVPAGDCEGHADGIQGFDGPPMTVVDVTIDFNDAACGTAAFFVPAGQGNTTVTVKNLLLMGGGYPFRLGVPGTVDGLEIVDGTWGYAPVDVECPLVGSWNATIVKITPAYRVAHTLRPQKCG